MQAAAAKDLLSLEDGILQTKSGKILDGDIKSTWLSVVAKALTADLDDIKTDKHKKMHGTLTTKVANLKMSNAKRN